MNKKLTFNYYKLPLHNRLNIIKAQAFLKEKIFSYYEYIFQKGSLFLIYLLHTLIELILLKFDTESGIKYKIFIGIEEYFKIDFKQKDIKSLNEENQSELFYRPSIHHFSINNKKISRNF